MLLVARCAYRGGVGFVGSLQQAGFQLFQTQTIASFSDRRCARVCGYRTIHGTIPFRMVPAGVLLGRVLEDYQTRLTRRLWRISWPPNSCNTEGRSALGRRQKRARCVKKHFTRQSLLRAANLRRVTALLTHIKSPVL